MKRYHSLAIDHEMVLPVLQRGLDDPGEALGPIISALGDQPHALAIPLQAQAIPVHLQLMEPLGPRGDDLARVGMQNSNLGMLLIYA